ncbi:sensor histidine kinase [Paenibacillus sp. J5C_2022]|uniref:cache domain-containing sensor histidine kinase n=1 Tax=Paenibacillus sp. J5C2022 TaxID=2977129 RepID=UPI0021D30018|nr:sensor histidine kinase [Paenibacillus sp. J5C2022]MCU6710444.1 sensor histidine kinase [Paenibacillus sp. J5C2022]
MKGSQKDMNDTTVRRRYLPIGYKLMLSYMLFVLLLVTVNGYISHRMYDASMRKQTALNLSSTLIQIRDNVAYKTDDIKRSSDTLYDNYMLAQILRADAERGDNYRRMRQEIIPRLEDAMKSVGIPFRLSVYFHNETISERYHISSSNDRKEHEFNIYHLKRIEDRRWYKMLPEEEYGQTMEWKQIEEDREESRISMVRRLIDSENPLDIKEIGIMRFSMSIAELFESVDAGKIGEGARLLVRDQYGQLLYSSGYNGAPHEWSSAVDMKTFVTLEEKMPGEGWTITAHVPMTIIEQEAKRIQTFIIAICVLCFILFTFTGVFISRYFSKRITKIVSVLNAFREGNLKKRMNYKGNDEFSQISNALNEMGEDVESLINKVYLTQLQKKEAELEMLQTQINPHFLYNTLSSISRLAKFGENEKLHGMVMSLAKFYRLTLNSGRSLIPVASEMEQAEAYVDIQKVKYGQRLEVTFDVDPDIWPYETLKLIIQPFIENVLKHAWCGDRIHVRIAVRLTEGDIVYQIIDDGLGMPKGRAEELLNSSDTNESGYGIRNIHQRIQLHYGSGYGVSIFSRLGVGTCVEVRIPARKRRRRELEAAG